MMTIILRPVPQILKSLGHQLMDLKAEFSYTSSHYEFTILNVLRFSFDNNRSTQEAFAITFMGSDAREHILFIHKDNVFTFEVKK